MPASFDNLGVRFDYPENWTVEDISDSSNSQQVVLSSPYTAFCQLSRHPAETPLEPLFDEALSALRTDYREIEVEPDDEVLEGWQLQGFSVSFFYLDLINTCWLRGFRTPRATYLVLFQAEDRDFTRTALVFRAILTGLIRNLAEDDAKS